MSGEGSKRNRSGVIWTLVVVLAILHQDFWLWDSDAMVLSFLPTGLAYHVLYSLLAAGLWALAILIAWPVHLEVLAEGADDPPSNPQEA